MALTLPFIITKGQAFEYRNDLLFIASFMVLISLILAQIVLPLITPSAEDTTFKRYDLSICQNFHCSKSDPAF